MRTVSDFTLNSLYGIGAALVVLAVGVALAWLPLHLMAPQGVFFTGSGWSMLLGAAASAVAGIGLLVFALRRTPGADEQGPSAHRARIALEHSEPPQLGWPFDTAASDAASPHAAPARTSAMGLEEILGANEMSELRVQVESLCRVLDQDDASGLLRAELMDSGVVLNAHRAAGLAQVLSQVIAGRELVDEFAADGLKAPTALLNQVREDLRSIADALGRLSHHWMESEIDGRAMSAELQQQVRLTAELTPAERLLFLSTLLLTAVSELSSALIDRYNRLQLTVHERAALLRLDPQPGVQDEWPITRSWPRGLSGERLPGTDGTDDPSAIPHWKLN